MIPRAPKYEKKYGKFPDNSFDLTFQFETAFKNDRIEIVSQRNPQRISIFQQNLTLVL